MQSWHAQFPLTKPVFICFRYALDGCDPCSYGGILWCFGMYDGPKGSDSTPVYGSIAKRPTSSIQRRLNAANFLALPVEAAALGDRTGAQPSLAGNQQPSIVQFFKPAETTSPGDRTESQPAPSRKQQPSIAQYFKPLSK